MVEEKVDGKIVLNQPAGHLEPDESLIDAVIRETREETAMLFEPEHLTGLYKWKLVDKNRTYLRLCFSGKVLTKLENQSLDTDIIRTRWLSYDEIIEHKKQLRSPLVLRCIDDYLAGQRYPLELLKDLD